jgi:hypothetical protein
MGAIQHRDETTRETAIDRVRRPGEPECRLTMRAIEIYFVRFATVGSSPGDSSPFRQHCRWKNA